MTAIKIALALRLVDLRRTSGLTQTQLAKKAGLSLRTLQAIEAGEVDLRLSTLLKLADCLGVSLQQFLNLPELLQDQPLPCPTLAGAAGQCLIGRFSVGIMLCDLSGKIWVSNGKLEDRLGLAGNRACGKMHIWDVFDGSDVRTAIQDFFTYLRKHQPRAMPFHAEVMTKNGEVLSIAMHWSYIRDHQSAILGFMAVWHF